MTGDGRFIYVHRESGMNSSTLHCFKRDVSYSYDLLTSTHTFADDVELQNIGISGTATLSGNSIATETYVDTEITSLSGVMDSDIATLSGILQAQITDADLDFQGDTGGALNITDGETLTISGGTGITTTGAGNTLTIDTDNTVATVSYVDTEITSLSGVAIAYTDQEITSLSGVMDSSITTLSGVMNSDITTLSGILQSQITDADLDFIGDLGGALVISGSEIFTISGGLGITTTGSGNTLTIDSDSAGGTAIFIHNASSGPGTVSDEVYVPNTQPSNVVLSEFSSDHDSIVVTARIYSSMDSV